MRKKKSAVTEPRNIDNAICTFCGCLCDDIQLTLHGDKIHTAVNACDRGQEGFLNSVIRQVPAAAIEGKPVELEEAIGRAARLLAQAKYPLVYGLAEADCDAQRAAVAVAIRIGGCLDTPSSFFNRNAILAFQAAGQSACTLGEVKNRAELVIFWGADPVTTHPRHGERYSISASGLFVPHGRKDRTIVVVDRDRTKTAEIADLFLPLKPGKDLEALSALRALIKGVALNNSVEEETGISLAQFADLSNRMMKCRYGVMFHDRGLSACRWTMKAALDLVRDLNDCTRFHLVPLGGPGNLAGAENVLTWQTGYPFGIGFHRGHPRFGPGEFTAEEVLARGEADVALIIACDPAAILSPKAMKHLATIPSIAINSTLERSTVAIDTPNPCLLSDGTVFRVDNVALPLPSLGGKPTLTDVLKGIETGLQS